MHAPMGGWGEAMPIDHASFSFRFIYNKMQDPQKAKEAFQKVGNGWME